MPLVLRLIDFQGLQSFERFDVPCGAEVPGFTVKSQPDIGM